jgi:serine protease Do
MNKLINIILIIFILFLFIYKGKEFFESDYMEKKPILNEISNTVKKNEMNIKNQIDLYDETVVRIRSQKVEFDWLEPYNNKKSYESIGTGFFINNAGYIVSNFHVIDKAIKVYIQIPKYGNKTYDCEIISVYPRLDMTLLKILDYKNKYYLDLGDSDNIGKGYNVMAVGYPLGQNKLKVTQGIISGFQDGDIQTDSAINPGNSGGPLIYNNKVIGINYSGYNDAQSVAYAIPINYLKINILDMFRNKFINFPILGVTFNNSNQIIMDISKLCSEGYYISNVFPKSTMDLAGVKKGDILCSFDGLKVDNYGEVFIDLLKIKFHIFDYLKYKKVNDNLPIKILRKENNEWKIIEKRISLLSNTYFPIRDYHFQYEKIDYQILGGMVIMNLTNNHLKILEEKEKLLNINKYTNVNEKLQPKLLITKILNGSKLSEDSVFRAPLILKKVNNIEVNTMDDLRVALRNKNYDNGIEYFSFLTENDKFLILGVKETAEEEIFLAKKFDYKLTEFTKNLLNMNSSPSYN